LPRRRDESIGDRGEVLVGVIQAEDEPARSHPAECQVFGAQVVLKHPVVARRLQIADRPYRGEISNPYVGPGFAQTLIEPGRPAVPHRIELAIAGQDLRRLQALKELGHGPHHVRVGIEGTAREAHVRRPILSKALHQVGAPAHHADRQTTGYRFSVRHHVGTDAKILLGPSAG